jgi:hypothetical protein
LIAAHPGAALLRCWMPVKCAEASRLDMSYISPALNLYLQRIAPVKIPYEPIVLLGALIAATSGCVSVNSPIVQEKLKTVSAGYTGCTPDENVLSNVAAKYDGSGTWNATCRGKTYLCSAVGNFDKSESFHCAPIAQ